MGAMPECILRLKVLKQSKNLCPIERVMCANGAVTSNGRKTVSKNGFKGSLSPFYKST
jgi:hypothetical protein